MHLKLAFAGFGNVARAFVRLLESRRQLLAENYGIACQITGIATGSHGCITSSAGLQISEILQRLEKEQSLQGIPGTVAVNDTESLVESCDADILFETTPLNFATGEPAATYLRQAFWRGIHAVTANKGPVACAYEELQTLAAQQHVQFRFEGTVMDGLPIFNLQEFCLPGVTVRGFTGILNSTTNFILTGMEGGLSFAKCLAEARELGIAETNADYDIDGWDAAVKAVVLANVLMKANLHPRDVKVRGIRAIHRDELDQARKAGKTLRLIASASASRTGVEIQVAPTLVGLDSLPASIKGTSSLLIFDTDLMGEIALLENHPRLEQTAYALFSDMLQIYKAIN